MSESAPHFPLGLAGTTDGNIVGIALVDRRFPELILVDIVRFPHISVAILAPRFDPATNRRIVEEVHETTLKDLRFHDRIEEGPIGSLDELRELVVSCGGSLPRCRCEERAVPAIAPKPTAIQDDGLFALPDELLPSNPAADTEETCVISTALVAHAGRRDDCRELRILRGFRDTYVRRLPDGPRILDEYYALSPRIVTCLAEAPDRVVVLDEVCSVVHKAVCCVERYEFREAIGLYTQLFDDLKSRFAASAT